MAAAAVDASPPHAPHVFWRGRETLPVSMELHVENRARLVEAMGAALLADKGVEVRRCKP